MNEKQPLFFNQSQTSTGEAPISAEEKACSAAETRYATSDPQHVQVSATPFNTPETPTREIPRSVNERDDNAAEARYATSDPQHVQVSATPFNTPETPKHEEQNESSNNGFTP